MDRGFVDLDPIFNHNLDEDYDFRSSGITRQSYCAVYMSWIQFCYGKRYHPAPETPTTGAAANATSPSTEASKRTSPRSSANPTPSPRDHGKLTPVADKQPTNKAPELTPPHEGANYTVVSSFLLVCIVI